MDAHVDTATYERRYRLIGDTIAATTARPGVELRWSGLSLEVAEHTRCVHTGEQRLMVWDDQSEGEHLCGLAASTAVTDDDLVAATIRSALRAIVNNDVHELCEHFSVDGHRIYDPHPDGRHYAPSPVTVTVCFDDEAPPDTATRPPATPRQLWDVPTHTATRVAATLVGRISCGTARFDADGAHLMHFDTYPDRDSGEPLEWSWRREWLCDLVIGDGGNPGAAIRAALIEACFTLAVQSVVHEAAEWLRVDGRRVYEPHPRPHQQYDRVWPQITFDRSALVAAAP